jgi:hypothetical protein
MRYFLVICFSFAFAAPGRGQAASFDPEKKYPVDQLRADFRFLKKNLEQTHPALYRYTSRITLQKFFDSLDHRIDRPMTEQQFLGLILLLNAKICDGHTMFLPSDAWTGFNDTLGKFLPLTLNIIDEKLYVAENNATDRSITPGDEIQAINGINTSDILPQLLDRQIRDGENQTYPEWILDHYFAAYYSFVFGQPDHFTLKVQSRSGQQSTVNLDALTKGRIRENRDSRRDPATTDGKGIWLERPAGEDFAVLTIKSFDTAILKNRYNQDFKKAVDSVFASLAEGRTKHLFLDLRDNQGGDFEPSRYLLSWLILKPAQYLVEGVEARTLRPRQNHFTGDLFVCINGGSYSATAIACACLHDQQRAIFVGEETGGGREVISGDPVEKRLPNTGIRCYISTTTFRIGNGRNDGHGLMPDYPVDLKPGEWSAWRRLLSI